MGLLPTWTSSSVETAMQRYEQLWRPVIDEKQLVARNGARWFLPDSAWRLRVRPMVIVDRPLRPVPTDPA